MNEWVFLYGLVAMRLAMFWVMLPSLSTDEFFPTHAKGVFLLALLPFMVDPTVLKASVQLDTGVSYLMLLLKEGLVGALLGVIVGLPLRLPEMVGAIIDDQRGMAVTSQYNPMMASEASILGQLLALITLTYFLASDGLMHLVSIMSGTFVMIPVGQLLPDIEANLGAAVAVTMTGMMKLFAILATPVMIGMLMADFALGLASRSAQSLNAFQLAQPIKSIIAIAMVALLQPQFLTAVMSWFNEVAETVGG